MPSIFCHLSLRAIKNLEKGFCEKKFMKNSPTIKLSYFRLPHQLCQSVTFSVPVIVFVHTNGTRRTVFHLESHNSKQISWFIEAIIAPFKNFGQRESKNRKWTLQKSEMFTKEDFNLDENTAILCCFGCCLYQFHSKKNTTTLSWLWYKRKIQLHYPDCGLKETSPNFRSYKQYPEN